MIKYLIRIMNFTEYGKTKLKELQKKWCRENQHKNYNNKDYAK